LSAHRESGLGVGEGFIETGGLGQLARFEDGAALEAFHVFGVLILGHELRARMFAALWIAHGVASFLQMLLLPHLVRLAQPAEQLAV